MKPESTASEEREYPHWNRIYFAVLVTLITVITALWLFSEAFE